MAEARRGKRGGGGEGGGVARGICSERVLTFPTTNVMGRSCHHEFPPVC